MRLLEIPVLKNEFKLIAFVFLVQLCMPGAGIQAGAQAGQASAQPETAAYAAMAPVDAYLIADRNSEIALARSAAPASISDGAEVMVLGTGGIHDRGKRHEWLSVCGRAIMGRVHRRSGVLESQNSLADLL